MHSAVQTAVVTIISYKSLSDLNFARYTEQYGSYMPSSPLGSTSSSYTKCDCCCMINGWLAMAHLVFLFSIEGVTISGGGCISLPLMH